MKNNFEKWYEEWYEKNKEQAKIFNDYNISKNDFELNNIYPNWLLNKLRKRKTKGV